MSDTETTIQSFIRAAKSKDWKIKTDSTRPAKLPNVITERYPNIPDDYLCFLSQLSTCCNPSEQAWFLCVDDYSAKDEDQWRWDEIERLELDAADDDDHREGIRELWNGQIPIAINVGYSCLSLSVRPSDFGSVFYSFKHCWDEPELVVDSFEDYLKQMTEFLNGSRSVSYKNEDGDDCVILEFADFL